MLNQFTKLLIQESSNPLSRINKEFKVTFRLNQGLYNYFMMYETIFYKYLKPFDNKQEEGIFN